MTYLQAIILGAVQGLGEFLPISSSAHLVLVPYIFRWPYHGITFDIALHMGTLVALLLFFWRDFVRLIRSGLTQGVGNTDGKMFWMVLAGCIPAAVLGFLFQDAIDTTVREKIAVMAVALAIMGMVLVVIDRIAASKRSLDKLGWSDALLIGLGQAAALLPGVSRSGATITVGRALGLTREAAARFSFYLSAPIIAGAGLLQLRHLSLNQIDGPFMVGVITAAVVGYISIGFLLEFLKKGSLALFAWYRFALAALVIVLLVVRRG